MPPWSDDPEAVASVFPPLARTGGTARAAAALHGHVARSRSGHRRRRHLRARGHGAVRQAEEGVTVGFYSPLPPARTGVADYAAALLAALRQLGRVDVGPRALRRRALSLGQQPAARRHLPAGAGASGRGGAARCGAASFPAGPARPTRLTSTSSSTTTASGTAGLAAELWRGARGVRRGSAAIFEFPMLKRAAERARAVIVHNPAAGRAVREHAPAASVIEIPHLFQAPELPTARDVARYRQELGLQPDDFRFRRVRLPARIEAAGQRAARRFAGLPPGAALLVAGAFVSEDLERCRGTASPLPRAWCASLIFRPPISGWPPRRWMPALTFDIRPRAKPLVSPFG